MRFVLWIASKLREMMLPPLEAMGMGMKMLNASVQLRPSCKAVKLVSERSSKYQLGYLSIAIISILANRLPVNTKSVFFLAA